MKEEKISSTLYISMKMLSRLRYLLIEGFEVTSLSGYSSEETKENAKLMYQRGGTKGDGEVFSECFEVSSTEMALCSFYFLKYWTEVHKAQKKPL